MEHSVHVACPCRTNVCMGPVVVLFPVLVSQKVALFYSYFNWLIIKFLLKLSLGGSIHRFGIREFINLWNLLLQGRSKRKYFLVIIKKVINNQYFYTIIQRQCCKSLFWAVFKDERCSPVSIRDDSKRNSISGSDSGVNFYFPNVCPSVF